MPEMHLVVSSNVEAVGYDPHNHELHVRFRSGAAYVYYDVEDWVYREFMEAGSKGIFFSSNIRDRYRYRKL